MKGHRKWLLTALLGASLLGVVLWSQREFPGLSETADPEAQERTASGSQAARAIPTASIAQPEQPGTSDPQPDREARSRATDAGRQPFPARAEAAAPARTAISPRVNLGQQGPRNIVYEHQLRSAARARGRDAGVDSNAMIPSANAAEWRQRFLNFERLRRPAER